MSVRYETFIIRDGNHASLAIPDEILAELGANKRAPLKVTVNGHSYQSTATAVSGQCRVVFPQKDRAAAGVGGGQKVEVLLELDDGYREVEMHEEFVAALAKAGLREVFDSLAYSHRREHARAIAEAKAPETRRRRIAAALVKLREAKIPPQ